MSPYTLIEYYIEGIDILHMQSLSNRVFLTRHTTNNKVCSASFNIAFCIVEVGFPNFDPYVKLKVHYDGSNYHVQPSNFSILMRSYLHNW